MAGEDPFDWLWWSWKVIFEFWQQADFKVVFATFWLILSFCLNQWWRCLQKNTCWSYISSALYCIWIWRTCPYSSDEGMLSILLPLRPFVTNDKVVTCTIQCRIPLIGRMWNYLWYFFHPTAKIIYFLFVNNDLISSYDLCPNSIQIGLNCYFNQIVVLKYHLN